MMNVVDSCGWLEYFAGGPNAEFFAPAIEDIDSLIVPSICILEVFKRILQQKSEIDAIQAISLMQQGEIVSLDTGIALIAAKISYEMKLPLADGVILATARAKNAWIWTQDADFKGIEGVKYKKK